AAAITRTIASTAASVASANRPAPGAPAAGCDRAMRSGWGSGNVFLLKRTSTVSSSPAASGRVLVNVAALSVNDARHSSFDDDGAPCAHVASRIPPSGGRTTIAADPI